MELEQLMKDSVCLPRKEYEELIRKSEKYDLEYDKLRNRVKLEIEKKDEAIIKSLKQRIFDLELEMKEEIFKSTKKCYITRIILGVVVAAAALVCIASMGATI